MALPTVYRESKGLSALEALANGVPLVAVRHGTFPELIQHTGGGLLCEPNNPADLAAKLREFIVNPALAAGIWPPRAGKQFCRTTRPSKWPASIAKLYRRLAYRQPGGSIGQVAGSRTLRNPISQLLRRQ